MKKIFLSSALLSIFLLYSCGGVIGNIEKYRFSNISIDRLKIAVNNVYSAHPEFKDFDTTKYKQAQSLGDGDYYCRIKENGSDYLFVYAYPKYPPPNDTIVEIALTSAASYGERLALAKNIITTQKKEYQKIFERYFIAEIRKGL
jgi:hypothetical protein